MGLSRSADRQTARERGFPIGLVRYAGFAILVKHTLGPPKLSGPSAIKSSYALVRTPESRPA